MDAKKTATEAQAAYERRRAEAGEVRKPEASFEFVCEWFERAAVNARAQGKAESAMLWEDGLMHLRHMASQRDDLVKALRECLENTGGGWISASVIDRARAALAKETA